MTKKEMFAAIAAVPQVAANEDMMKFIEHEIALLDKRNSTRSSKPTKAQLEKNAQRDAILEFLAENPASTCAAVADHLGVTLHSASGLLATLRKQDVALVKREYKGKTPVYSLGSEFAEA